MLRDTSEDAVVDIESVVACAPETGQEVRPDWRTVDRELRAIRQRRAALDADEARWLREAEALQIWRPLGMVSALDYLERVLGYAPRTAHDRLRVARALGALPQLTAALASGDLTFSAVRELTRVVTPATETSWIATATGKNLRQIEDLVADHRPGDRPDDPPDPAARTHVVRFELAAEIFALLRQARMVLDDEHGENLPDDAFIAALCDAVLDDASGVEPTGRAKFQIAVTVCQRCRQGWQEGAGAQIAINPAAVDRAMCDAQHIGSIDGDTPERAHQDIPPSVVRFVWRRDGGRCRVDGCRSSRGLELHHVVHRAHGGSHDATNLILACSACHQAHHAGLLTISGTADDLEVRRPGHTAAADNAHRPRTKARANANVSAHVGMADATTSAGQRGTHVGTADATTAVTHRGTHVGTADATTAVTQRGTHVGTADATSAATHRGTHVGTADATTAVTQRGTHVGTADATTAVTNADAHESRSSRLNAAILHSQAKSVLTALGWKPTIAAAAVAAAAAAQGVELTLERLVFESLRRCPARKA